MSEDKECCGGSCHEGPIDLTNAAEIHSFPEDMNMPGNVNHELTLVNTQIESIIEGLKAIENTLQMFNVRINAVECLLTEPSFAGDLQKQANGNHNPYILNRIVEEFVIPALQKRMQEMMNQYSEESKTTRIIPEGE